MVTVLDGGKPQNRQTRRQNRGKTGAKPGQTDISRVIALPFPGTSLAYFS